MYHVDLADLDCHRMTDDGELEIGSHTMPAIIELGQDILLLTSMGLGGSELPDPTMTRGADLYVLRNLLTGNTEHQMLIDCDTTPRRVEAPGTTFTAFVGRRFLLSAETAEGAQLGLTAYDQAGPIEARVRIGNMSGNFHIRDESNRGGIRVHFDDAAKHRLPSKSQKVNAAGDAIERVEQGRWLYRKS